MKSETIWPRFQQLHTIIHLSVFPLPSALKPEQNAPARDESNTKSIGCGRPGVASSWSGGKVEEKAQSIPHLVFKLGSGD